MVDEDELERRLLAVRRLRGRRGGAHDHPLRGRERAARLQLRDPLDLDETHATRADRRAEPGLVAEHGDLDPGRERGLDQAAVRGYLDRAVVDGDRNELGEAHTVPAL